MKQRHYFTAPISYNETMLHNDMTLYDIGASEDNEDKNYNNNSPVMRSYVQTRRSPFPTMPSELFTSLAQSQFELLSNSLVYTTTSTLTATTTPTTTAHNKISSMALYLPKENEFSGQLEFVPAVTYPDPSLENKRVFIANSAVEEKSSSNNDNDASSDQQNLQTKQQHQPPVIPSSIQTPLGLPGFFQAKDLIPRYPFVTSSEEEEEDVSSNDDDDDASLLQQQQQQREMMFTTVSSDSKIGVSVVEEISSSSSSSSGSTLSGDDHDEKVLALPQPLSVTLFSGMETLGVLMIWPNKNNNGRDGGKNSNNNQRSNNNTQWNWTANDKLQVSRAAKSLALALSMDNERVSSQISSEQFQVAMADSLHQVKSPLQALRTFGKLLQRQLAEENNNNNNSASGVVTGGSVGPTIRRQRQMLKLAENMAAQGERVVDLIEPMDMLVNTRSNYLLSGDVKQKTTGGLALVRSPSFLLPNGSNYDDDNDNDDDSMKSSPVLGDLQMELAFPNDVLGSCVYAFSMVSREKGINFDAIGFEPDAELPACLISSKQLQEAVSNVLENGIKYAPMRRKGSRGRPRIPTVKVSLTANEPPLAAGCTLWVEDNGPGIPDDERESVFERGYRSKEWTDDVDGSGLGLAVARQMITQMGGRIDLAEDGGPSKLQGTTVRIILFRDPEV